MSYLNGFLTGSSPKFAFKETSYISTAGIKKFAEVAIGICFPVN
jgi:hypothetical protein